MLTQRDMDDRRGDEAAADLCEEAVEAACRLAYERDDETGRDRRPEHLAHRLRGPFCREVLAMEQVERSGADVRAVTGGGLRLFGERSGGELPAPPAPPDRAVFRADERRVGGVEDLTTGEALDRSVGEICSAVVTSLRLVIDDLVGRLAQRKARTRSAKSSRRLDGGKRRFLSVISIETLRVT